MLEASSSLNGRRRQIAATAGQFSEQTAIYQHVTFLTLSLEATRGEKEIVGAVDLLEEEEEEEEATHLKTEEEAVAVEEADETTAGTDSRRGADQIVSNEVDLNEDLLLWP